MREGRASDLPDTIAILGEAGSVSMPKVFSWNGHRFHFYANEGDPREPVHIHVRKGRDNAKFWLWPDVVVAESKGFPAHMLSQLSHVIEGRRTEIESAWNDFFS